MFHRIGSPLAKARGQTYHRKSLLMVAYPRTSVCKLIWKKMAMTLTTTSQIRTSIDELLQSGNTGDLSGPATGMQKKVCRRRSRKLITKMEGNISGNDIEHLARVSFEESAKLLWGKQLHKERKQSKGPLGDTIYALTVIITISMIRTTRVPVQRVKLWGAINFPGSGIAVQPCILPLTSRNPLETVEIFYTFLSLGWMNP